MAFVVQINVWKTKSLTSTEYVRHVNQVEYQINRNKLVSHQVRFAMNSRSSKTMTVNTVLSIKELKTITQHVELISVSDNR